jgi:FdrA protein
MIDPTLRLEHLARVADDPATGAILLDVVLGHAAEPDPAALLAPAVASARERGVPVVVSCIGTEVDPQGLTRQARALAAAGAEVHLSNAAATRRAVEIVTGGDR